MSEKLLSVDELAEFLNVSTKTIYRLLKRRGIPAFRVANQWRFEKDAINAWLSSNRVDPNSDVA